MKTAGASLDSCSFTLHLNESEVGVSIEKISSEHTFLELLSMLAEKKSIYLPPTTYSFAIKTGVEGKKVMKKVMAFQGKDAVASEMIEVKMEDTIGSSTYRTFYKHGRMELWVQPPVADSESMVIWLTNT